MTHFFIPVDALVLGIEDATIMPDKDSPAQVVHVVDLSEDPRLKGTFTYWTLNVVYLITRLLFNIKFICSKDIIIVSLLDYRREISLAKAYNGLAVFI